MSSIDDAKRIYLRNRFLGEWAAEKLHLAGQGAEDYAKALAMAAFEPERGDVFSKIRKDFDAAGVVQTDEQILLAMTQFLIEAGKVRPSGPGNGLAGAGVMLARKLMSR